MVCVAKTLKCLDISLKKILHAAPKYDYLKRRGFMVENNFTEKK
jgi:hypothetical protein